MYKVCFRVEGGQMWKEDTGTLGLGMVLKLQTGIDSEASRSYMFDLTYSCTAIWMSLLFPSEKLQVLE